MNNCVGPRNVINYTMFVTFLIIEAICYIILYRRFLLTQLEEAKFEDEENKKWIDNMSLAFLIGFPSAIIFKPILLVAFGCYFYCGKL